MRNKIFMIILALCLLLVACQPTPDHEYVIQKDTERLVETVKEKNNKEEASATDQDNSFIKTDRHYTYEFTSNNAHLSIHADADVYMPESGRMPMARVKGEYFTDAFAKKIFDYIYHGTDAYTASYETRRATKSELADMIAYYQSLIDAGQTDREMMNEDEAITYINEMKEEYKTAPDEATEPEQVISDGTMQLKKYITHNEDENGKQIYSKLEYYELRASGSLGEIQIRRHGDRDLSIEDWFSYHRESSQGLNRRRISYSEDSQNGRVLNIAMPYDKYVCLTDDHTCKYGQTLSPYDAVELCRTFFKDVGVDDVEPVSTVDTYITNSKNESTIEDCIYFIDFIRTVNGIPVAYMSSIDGAQYPVEIPWNYEKIRFIVDKDGINSITWQYPVEVTEITSNNAAVLTFEEAVSVFESMCRIIYESQADRYGNSDYTVVQISKVELSLVRVRERNTSGRTGLYIPAWVFYGKEVNSFNGPVTQEQIDQHLSTIIMAINAIDGSLIDLSKGY